MALNASLAMCPSSALHHCGSDTWDCWQAENNNTLPFVISEIELGSNWAPVCTTFPSTTTHTRCHRRPLRVRQSALRKTANESILPSRAVGTCKIAIYQQPSGHQRLTSMRNSFFFFSFYFCFSVLVVGDRKVGLKSEDFQISKVSRMNPLLSQRERSRSFIR